MPARSLIVTADLQRAVHRDFVLDAYARPSGALSLAVAPIVVLLVMLVGVDGGIATGTRIGIGVVAAAVALAFSVALTWSRAGRAVRTLYPVGGTATVAVEDDGLHVAAPSGEGTSRWESFTSMTVRRATVLLRRNGTRIVTLVPRSLVAEDELQLIRGRIGRPA